LTYAHILIFAFKKKIIFVRISKQQWEGFYKLICCSRGQSNADRSTIQQPSVVLIINPSVSDMKENTWSTYNRKLFLFISTFLVRGFKQRVTVIYIYMIIGRNVTKT
jgi:hypothetical protein